MSKTSDYLSNIIKEIEGDSSSDAFFKKKQPLLTTNEVIHILMQEKNEDFAEGKDSSINHLDKSLFSFDMQELGYWRENNNTCYQIDYYRPINTHTRKLGRLLEFAKKVVRKLNRSLIEPICQDTSQFNGSVTASINALYNNEIVTEEFINFQTDWNQKQEENLSRLSQQLGEIQQSSNDSISEFKEVLQAYIDNVQSDMKAYLTSHERCLNQLKEIEVINKRLQEQFNEYKTYETVLETVNSLAEALEQQKNRLESLIHQINAQEVMIEGVQENVQVIQTQHTEFTNSVENIRAQQEHQEREIVSDKSKIKDLQERLRQNEDDFDRAITNTELNFLRNLNPSGTCLSQTKAKQPAQDTDKETISATQTYQTLDYFKFENHFRGSRRGIKNNQKEYLKYFSAKSPVLDLGCGRGEFLELMKEEGIAATGIDSYKEFVDYCKVKGLNAVEGTVPQCLKGIGSASIGGIFASQLVEHITFHELTQLCHEANRIMLPGACIIIETPNPTCLSTFMNSFYMDPSHNKPVHPKTLQYILEQSGFSNVQIHYTQQSKAAYRLPLLSSSSVNNLNEFNDGINFLSDIIFGSQDYAVIAYKQ